MSKEEILQKHCEGNHPSEGTYLDLDGAIDGKTAHVLAAMEEYAQLMVKEALYQQSRRQERFDNERYGEDL